MNKLPVQLVHFLRRLVNVISSISLSNHYLLDTPRPLSIWSWLILPDSLSIDLGWRLYTGSRPTEGISGDEHGEPRLSQLDATSSLQPTRPHGEQRSPSSPPPQPPCPDTIHRLMSNPTLFNPARAPRYPIVLCHGTPAFISTTLLDLAPGLYGFDVRGPAAFPGLRLHYWSSVLSILKEKLGAEVIVTGVPATGSIASRADSLDSVLQQRARGRGVNLMAHSMGGLDCRQLITHIRPTEYVPLSLTSVSTPHRGSPFMDWCAQYLGLGRRQDKLAHQPANDHERQIRPEPDPISSTDLNGASEKRETAFRLPFSTLPSSFTTLIDSPAYANLTTSYLNDVFNPSTPDDPRVKYFSVASRIDEMNIWHPLWFPKMVLDDAERKARDRLKAADGDLVSPASCDASIPLWKQEDEWGNDGLVTVQSARWGEFLGILDGCDHWEIRGARRMEMNVELPAGIGNITNRVVGEGWDLSRVIGAWKKQEKVSSEGLELAQATSIFSSDAGGTEQMARDSRNDPVVKASTDKLSAVFDWIVEHAPSTSGNPSPSEEKLPPEKTARFDLERFYVALTRKLYDEGL